MDDWVKLKNSCPGPPLLPQAIQILKDKGINNLFQPSSSSLLDNNNNNIFHLSSYPINNISSNIFGIIIPSVLLEEECNALIESIPSEGNGYMSPEEVRMLYRGRVVHRYMTRDSLLSELILNRIRECIPNKIDNGDFVDISSSWRFLRYEVGGHQVAHIDGREKSEIPHPDYSIIESRLTVQMYLNSHRSHDSNGYLGGEMEFLSHDLNQIKHTHYPKAGDCIIFYQEKLREGEFQLVHEAKPVLEGTKYAMRTVIDYGWN
mmetsp:Transcript_9182/g.9711  ORF Transcript_9182/g.9711 Transcript_9182/m.9711 type:complete len:262 (-) Transcript_9182:129-914(-)